MSQQLIDTLIAIAIPIITAALSALALTVRQYINIKIAAIQHEQLRLRVADLVKAAEQQFSGIGSDTTKLNYVTEQAWVFVQQLGLATTLTRDNVKALIEAAVHAMTIEETTATATVSLPAATSTGTTSTQATITSTTSPGGVGTAVGYSGPAVSPV